MLSRQFKAWIFLALYGAALVAGLWFTSKPWDLETQIRLQREELFDPNSALKVRDFVAILFWTGGVINLALVVVLTLTTRFWVGDPAEEKIESAPQTTSGSGGAISPKMKKTLWLAALGAMILGGLVAWPRMNHSLWGDEDYTLRLHLHGYCPRDFATATFQDDGKPIFRSLNWRDAIFGYRTTNNHFLYTILTKATMYAWQEQNDYLVKDDRGRRVLGYQFDEVVLRVWPFIAGVLSIGAWIWMFARCGFPRTALALAFLLPWHSWFNRYLAEARGYSFIFLLLPLMVIAMMAAVDRGRWRHWIAFGVCQFLILYSWPAMILQVLGFNVVALILIAKRSPALGSKLGGLWKRSLLRWTLVCTVGGLLLFQLVSPGIPQVQNYLNNQSLSLPVWFKNRPANDQPWIKNEGSLLALGMKWEDAYRDGVTNPYYVVVERLANTTGRSWIETFLIFFYVFALIGFIWFCFNGRGRGWLLAFGFLVPIVCFYYYLGYDRGKYLFAWYFVYATPFVLASAIAGVLWTCRGIGGLIARQRGERWTQIMGTILFGGALLWLAWPKIEVMTHQPVNPLRESVEATRQGINYRDPYDPDNWKVLTAHAHLGAFCYDPWGQSIEKAFSQEKHVPGLTRLMRQADEAEIPLFVNLGYPEDAAEMRPELFRLLDDEELFEKGEMLWGLDVQHSRRIYRYRGGFFSPLSGK